MTHRIATIDVGTNTVLLTIAEVGADGALAALCEESVITRIGEGLSANPHFRPEAMDRTAAVLVRYAALCKDHHVDRIIAVGTAAFRKARNAPEFIARIVQACGFTIQIISGKDEAKLSFDAATRDFGGDALVLDIGGGSSEFVWRHDDQLIASSLAIGAVSLHEQYAHTDPIAAHEVDAMQRVIHLALAQLLEATTGTTFKRAAHPRLIALAGTATTLGAMQLGLRVYSHAQVHGVELHITDLHAILTKLRAATLAQRRNIPGLEAARADVIYSGSLILTATMQQCGYDRVTISDRGVRWGLLYRALAAHTSGDPT